MNKVQITTVTPVYSGKDFLPELVAKLEMVRERWQENQAPMALTEAIFVNDASEDGSLEVLYSLQSTKNWIKVINLSQNYGQHQATVAGILHSSGDWIVTLDEDLQHDPQLIDGMLESAAKSESDIVYANPKEKAHGNTYRDFSSKFFKKLVSFATGNKFVEKFNSFRLIRGSIARAASSICSHGTYFDVALCWFTNRVLSIRLPLKDLRFIENKKSGYSPRKLMSHAKRLIVSSEVKIIRVGASIGIFSMLISTLLAIKTLITKFISPESIPIQGWTSLFLISLFFGGLLALMLGIALEYISVILLHIQGKPTFFAISRLSDKDLHAYFEARLGDDRFSEKISER